MTRTEIIARLDELGIKPSRRLGQNFLVDRNLLLAIVAAAAPQRGERILEVGAGMGVLTRELLGAGARVTTVEVDRRLCELLRSEFGNAGGLVLVEGDACDVDYDRVMGAEPFRCVANLPYSVSSVLIAHLLGLRNAPSEMFLLLQLEMAQRLAAVPRTKAYGALSVRVQTQYAVELLRRVPPEVFFPQPDVGSAFVRLLRRGTATGPERPLLRDVVRLGFSQRRKRLAKLLGAQFGAERVGLALAGLGLSPDCRAEELSPEQFGCLATALATADECRALRCG